MLVGQGSVLGEEQKEDLRQIGPPPPGKGKRLILLVSHSSKFDLGSAEDVDFQTLERTLLLIDQHRT